MGDRPEGMSDEEIRADIAHTRAELSETLDAIQDRLRPSNLAAQARESVRDATVGKVKAMATTAGEKASEMMAQTRDAAEVVVERVRTNPLIERIRDHPVPAALAGIGLAWLALADRGSAARRRYDRVDREAGGFGHAEYAVGTTGQGREAGAVWSDETSRPGLREAAEGVRRTSRRAGSQLQQAMRTNPLAVGAIAAGVGAAIGFALPETERENEWMGESRDAMIDRAQEMARDAAERVKDAADSVKGAADQAIDTIARGE
jgi:hypothetical protein